MTRAFAWLWSLAMALAAAGCGGGGGGGGGSSTDGAADAATGSRTATTFSRSFGGPGFDEARAAAATRDGGYVFVGAVGGDSQGGDTDVWIAKLDAAGNTEWQRAIGGRAAVTSERHRDFDLVRPTADGGTIAAGRAYDRNTDAPAPTPTGVDLWVAKHNAAGQVEWQRELDSGAWPGRAFAGPAFGRGESADDTASDVRVLPDGGYVVAGTSTANVVDADTSRVSVDAVSVFAARLDAQGQVLWQRRFVDEYGYTSRPLVTATSDNGAVLAFVGTFDGRPRLRILRLDAAGNPAWQVDEETGDAYAALQTQDLGLVIAYDAFGSYSRLLRLDSGGRVVWRHDVDGISVRALAERCTAAGAGAAPTCELYAGGSFYVEGNPDDNYREPRAQLLRLSAAGERIAERIDEETAVIADLRMLDETSLVALSRRLRGTTQRLVLDAATLQTRVASSTRFDATSAQIASPTRILATRSHAQEWTSWFSPEPLSDALRAGPPVRIHDILGDDVAVAVVEIERGSFIVAGRSNSFDDDARDSHWLVRVTDGRVDWQRRIDAASDALPVGMTSAVDGGVVLAAGDGEALRLIKVTADGQVAWQTGEFGGGLDVRDVQAVGGDGYVVAGRIGTPAVSTAFVMRLDAAGQPLWSRRYGGLGGDSVEPLDEDGDGQRDDGFLVSGAAAAGPLVHVMKLDATGAVVWARRYGVEGASVEPPRTAKARQAPGGGYVIGTTEVAAIAPQGPGQPFGQSNVLLLHLDRDGAVQWTRSYGAFLDERLHDMQVLPDGGVLVAGGSDSLGERSEAWLLRLGADGLPAAGCNAHLSSLPPAAVSTAPLAVSAGVLDRPARAVAAPASADTAAVAVTPATVEARQCLGSANAPEPTPAGPSFTLTLEQSGSRTGVVSSTPAGLVCGTAAAAPCSASFPAGSEVVLAVALGSVDAFLRWEDCDELTAPHSGGAARCRVRMDRDRRVRAVFGQAQDRFRLSVSVVGTGSVRSGDEGIRCGAFYGAEHDCEHVYDRLIAGTTLPTRITLGVFTHAEGFQGWGGDCAAHGGATAFELTLDADKHCTATFAGPPPSTLRLDVQKGGNGSGSVVSAPAGIACGDTCGASFDVGSTVRLLASEDAGSAFDGWNGCDRLAPSPTGSIPVCEVDMTAARSVGAAFKRAVGGGRFLLEMVVFGQDGIVESGDHGVVCTAAGPDCQELYAPGAAVALSFNLLRAAGRFMGWGGDCAGFGSSPTPTLVMNEDKHCTARFSSPS